MSLLKAQAKAPFPPKRARETATAAPARPPNAPA